jgi:FAD:protein FMN transferase
MSKKKSRRDFLYGRSFLDIIRKRFDRDPPELNDDSARNPTVQPQEDGSQNSASSPGEQETYLLSISRDAMASTFEVNLNAGQYPHGTDVALTALDEIDRLEQRFSYFVSDSELSLINQRPVGKPVLVDDELFELLTFSQQLWRETDGAFDIACAALWKAWGFSRHQGAVPSEEEIETSLERSGMRYVELNEEQKTLTWKKSGVELNLGAVGKGYAVDVCAADMQRAEVRDFLIHGAQSSVVAQGKYIGGKTLDGDPIGNGWSIGVAHPMRTGKRLGEIILRNRALGTSGSGRQFFRHEGRRYSHIIDPRTGRPAEGVYSTTVVAPTAQEADALSTAFFVLGADFAVEYCRKRPELAAIVVEQTNFSPGYKIVDVGFGNGEFFRYEE